MDKEWEFNKLELIKKNKIDAARKHINQIKYDIEHKYTEFVTNLTKKTFIKDLSDEEIVTLWEIIKNSSIKDVDQNVKDFFDGNKEAYSAFNTKEEETEKLVDQTKAFKLDVVSEKAQIENVLKTLVKEEITEEVNEELKEIYDENKEIESEALELLNKFDEFENKYKDGKFTGTKKEIQNELTELRKEIRTLKNKQIELYNKNIGKYNEDLKKLKDTYKDNKEIQSLLEMETLKIKVGSYTTYKYLEKIKYKELIENINKLQEYKKNLKIDDIDDSKDNIDGNPSDNLDNPDNEEPEDKKTTDTDKPITAYKEIMNKINNAIEKAEFVDMCINYLIDNATEKDKELFDKSKDDIQALYDSLKQEIEIAKNENRINDIEEENLNRRLNDLRNIIEHFKNIEIVKAFEWTCIDNTIESIEEAILVMETVLNTRNKIKGSKVRETIDEEFERIQKSIDSLTEVIEKEENPEEKEKIQERLDKASNKLDELRKKYLEKCPLFVKTARRTKKFYKKHNKAVLIAAGLAGIALTHATVGPVLIPAIMKGNLIIGHKIPALRTGLRAVNRVLGSGINAKVVDGMWYLANGAKLTAPCSSTLLKGLAYSIGGGLGAGAVTAGIIKEATNLIRNIKEKIDNKFGKGTFDDEKTLDETETIVADMVNPDGTITTPSEETEEPEKNDESIDFDEPIEYELPEELEEEETNRHGR